MPKLNDINLLQLVKDCLQKNTVTSIFFGCPSSLFSQKTFFICIHKSRSSYRKSSQSVRQQLDIKMIYKYLRILSNGTELSAERTLVSKLASFDDTGNFRYTRFANPQHCSIKLSSQWNFGKNRTSKPHALQVISRSDSTSVKLG